jgi:hypothetical protein
MYQLNFNAREIIRVIKIAIIIITKMKKLKNEKLIQVLWVTTVHSKRYRINYLPL